MHSSSRHFSNSKKPIIVLLHGFLGSGEQFSHLMPELRKASRPVTVDIRPLSNEPTPSELTEPTDPAKYSEPRKGMDEVARMDMPERLDTDSLDAGLRETIERIRTGSGAPLVLLGYSMGGRLALSFAARHAGLVDGLVLESTTAGIADPDQRSERRANDRRKAEQIRQDFGKFLDEWDRNPLFHPEQSVEPPPEQHHEPQGSHPEPRTEPTPESQPYPPLGENLVPGDRIHPVDRLMRIQHTQDPEIMAKWLEEFGTGVMPPVWDRLGRIRVPVLLITGASDPKFCDISDRMKTQLADARHVVIQGAAHRVHLDRPAEYAAALNDFLSKQIFTG